MISIEGVRGSEFEDGAIAADASRNGASERRGQQYAVSERWIWGKERERESAGIWKRDGGCDGMADLKKLCNQLSSRFEPPCDAEDLEAVWGIDDRRRPAGHQVARLARLARVDGGAWAQGVGGNVEGGADESLEWSERVRGGEGFRPSRVTSFLVSAWSTPVLVSHRVDFFSGRAPKRRRNGEMAKYDVCSNNCQNRGRRY